MKGRALLKYNLLRPEDRESLERAVEALCSHLDQGSKAAQDFRHALQQESESVVDFIQRLELLFRMAYGHDLMSDKTRANLLYGQLQEGSSMAAV